MPSRSIHNQLQAQVALSEVPIMATGALTPGTIPVEMNPPSSRQIQLHAARFQQFGNLGGAF